MKTTRFWSLAALTALSLGGLGCAEALEPVHTAADTRPSDRRLPVPSEDDFWMANQWSEQRRPAPERPRSISLGYIGEGVLPGGITRDDPVPPPRGRAPGAGQTWQEYANNPGWGPGAASTQLPPSSLQSPSGSQPARRCRCDY